MPTACPSPRAFDPVGGPLVRRNPSLIGSLMPLIASHVTQPGPRHCTTCSCRSGGVLRWRPVVAVLLFMACWDTAGLLVGGEGFYTSPSYEVLRDVAGDVSVGGMTLGFRVYGVALLLITGVVAWTLLAQRHRGGTVSKSLRFGLSCMAAYWVAWCFGVCMAFVVHGEIYAWGSIGKLVGTAAIAVLAARVPPPKADTRRPTGTVTCAVGGVPVAATRSGRATPPPTAARS